MREKIAFITDSCGDLPQEVKEREGVFVLPVMVTCEGKEYRDGEDITSEKVYEVQRKGDNVTTSLPTGEMLENLVKEIVSQGYEKAVVITMSSSISGTWNFCRLFFSECKELDCIVYDSKMASLAQGALLVELMDEVNGGKLGWEQIPERLEELRKNSFPCFGIDTLEFLQKNGRIGKATAFAGNLLHIMPILSFDEKGVINPLEKVRGRKKRLERLKEIAVESAEKCGSYRLFFVDGGNGEMLEELKTEIFEKLGTPAEVMTSKLGCALSAHLGENMIGVCVLGI